MFKKTLSKRTLPIMLFKTALKGTTDVIHRTSPTTGKLMEHVGDNMYRDMDTGQIYKAEGTLAEQSKQDQILYPLSA